MKYLARELWRKLAHLVIGTGCLLGGILIATKYGAAVLDSLLATVLFALVLCDVLIADYGWKLPLYNHLQRQHEERGLHTATLAFLSSVLVYELFVPAVAIPAIAMLIYGDAAAALVGLATDSGQKKTKVQRIAAMFLVSAGIGWFGLGWPGVAMAVAATLAECLPSRIDDALTIPLFAGLVGHVVVQLL